MQAYRRTDMLEAFDGLGRFIATSRVASEKRTTVFTFVDALVRPGDSLTAFALDDNYFFGILSSSLHRALVRGPLLAARNRPPLHLDHRVRLVPLAAITARGGPGPCHRGDR